MTIEQEKKFNETIDNLDEATNEGERAAAIHAFITEGKDLERVEKPLKLDPSNSGLQEQRRELLKGVTNDVPDKLEEQLKDRVRTEDLLNDVYEDIKKASAIMGDFQDDYYFLNGMEGCRFDCDFEGNKNLSTWVLEYNRIMVRMGIVDDYIQKIELALRDRLKEPKRIRLR